MALIVASGAMTSSVWAQPLGGGVINAGNIGAGEKKAIEDHVALHIKDLGGDDPEKIRKAKNALVNPLLEPAVSVPFRLEYSRVLAASGLGELCKSKNETAAINALRLAGEVAENEMLGLVEEGFKDTRSAVRYAAVFAAGRAFEQVMPADRSVAATSSKLEQVVRGVVTAMNKDKEETLIIDAASRSLLSAARVERPRYESIGKLASAEVCKGLSKRVAAAGPDDLTIVEAGQRAAAQFGEILGGAKGPQFDKDARKEAVTLAGELAAWVVRQINTPKIPQVAKNDAADEAAKKRKDREPFKTVLATAENAVLSAIKSAGVNPPAARLVPAFDLADRGGDANVVVQTKDWLIRDVMAKAPFEISADRFKLK